MRLLPRRAGGEGDVDGTVGVGHPGSRTFRRDLDVQVGDPFREAVAVVAADLRDLGVDGEGQDVGVEVVAAEGGDEVGDARTAVARRPDRDADGGLGVEVDVADVVAEEHHRCEAQAGRDLQRCQFLGEPAADGARGREHRQPCRGHGVVEVRRACRADGGVDLGLR